MEPGAAAALYGAETAVEGTVGAGVAIAKATMPLRASFQPIPTSASLPRSSHSLSIVKGRAYIFGGEVQPREPVDNSMHILTLPSSSVVEADYKSIPASPSAPPPRVGHTAAVVADRIYIFGGRGGKEMTPLEENGRVWVFDTMTMSWSYLDPAEKSPYPAPRSYHASVASEHPLAVKSSTPGDSEIQHHGTLFIHAGCPTNDRLADTWSFDIAARYWSKLPDAPGPARGGTSLALARDRLYRFGGFDGNDEIGGGIDYLELAKGTFDDKAGKGELAITLRSGKWETIPYTSEADGSGPGKRSVAALHPVTTGQGRNYLLLLLGERNPSSSGHAAAGAFWDDVWSYQLRPDGMTAASFKDATRMLVGAKTAEGTWAKVEIPEFSMKEGDLTGNRPQARGWFASAQGADVGNGSVVLWGGLNESNERLADGWILTIES